MLAVFNTPGSGSPAEVRETSEPSAAPDEAIVEVRAFSLNRGELSLLANRPEGWRPGQDISGVVVEAAADGSGPEVGARVVGLVDGAGWSQKVAVPTGRMAPLPEGVTFQQAASLPIAGLTALRLLRSGGSILGRKVLVTGASGGVGRFAVQLAANSGAEVTAVSRSEKSQGLGELGASAVISDIQDSEGGFDLILESVGGESLEKALRAAAPGAKVLVYGNSSSTRAGLDLFDFTGVWPDGVEIRIFFYASGGVSFGEDLSRLVGLVDRGLLTPEVGAEGSWRELERILEDLSERRIRGKAVLDVD